MLTSNQFYSRIVAGMAFVCSLMLFSGCGSSEAKPETFKVSGTVTFDGKPIQEGDILFFPSDGKGREVAATIKDGKYEALVQPGVKEVRILATRQHPTETEPDINGNPIPKIVSYIPKKYNEESELTLQVTGDIIQDYTNLVSK
ncbi:hypothetical protein [Gimesia aquarii]|uniref:Carboxypeptidase regulatory-like domain-containing protein n=1 Tax=Gimesia aquarii TaxID=2527964 RepID=A0A517X1K0_9PLAN|nr:hypothetical protein [Gimesia aquarii]QDU11380.1 hypothetical protein V202x_48010 [Gimesia aquarii]